jgi:sulfatase modifying factor 1
MIPLPHTSNSDSASQICHSRSPVDGMIRIPGGTFRMGSDQHYPEEAPAHRVTVDAFWMDRHPVTNKQFKEFVRATGHVTVAEVMPDPKDYPGMLPHMIHADSLTFHASRLSGEPARFQPVVVFHERR